MYGNVKLDRGIRFSCIQSMIAFFSSTLPLSTTCSKFSRESTSEKCFPCDDLDVPLTFSADSGRVGVTLVAVVGAGLSDARSAATHATAGNRGREL
eukprot:g3996.t1